MVNPPPWPQRRLLRHLLRVGPSDTMETVLEFSVVYLRGRYRRDADVLLRLDMEQRQVTVIKARTDREPRVFASTTLYCGK